MLPSGADDFTPLLILVVIKARTPYLASNLAYIERYRYAAHITRTRWFVRAVSSNFSSLDPHPCRVSSLKQCVAGVVCMYGHRCVMCTMLTWSLCACLHVWMCVCCRYHPKLTAEAQYYYIQLVRKHRGRKGGGA